MERSYEIIKELDPPEKYAGFKYWWAPNGSASVAQVKPEKLGCFEKIILKKYFDMELSDLGIGVS